MLNYNLQHYWLIIRIIKDNPIMERHLSAYFNSNNNNESEMEKLLYRCYGCHIPAHYLFTTVMADTSVQHSKRMKRND